jgi:zinc protease
LGTRSSFQKTTGAMLKKFYDTWYAPNNAIMVIVGDVQPAEVLGEVRKLFGDIPSRQLPQHPRIQLEPVKADTLALKTDLPYGLAVVALRLPGSDSPDYAAAEILADVLSSQRGRLYSLVPEGRALYAGFSMNGLPKASLGYAIAAFPAGTDGNEVVADVRNVLAEEVRKGVSADLVEAAKRLEVAGAEFQKNSISGLAMAWSEALAVEGRRSPDEDVQAMKKVSVEDVNRVASKYLDLEHSITAVLTPQPSGRPVATKGFGGTESFAPKETKAVQLPAWADKAVKRVTVPASTVHPVSTTLANGLRLIVQPETVGNTIGVYGHVKNNPDLQVSEGKEGVDQVLDRLFSYGTTSLDRVAFQKALDDIGASESAGTSFSLEVLADHFDRGVQLLADNELQPALPEGNFKIVQRQVAGAAAGELKSPDYLTSRAITAALVPQGDPTLRQATPETISSLSIQDVRNYYHQVFRPDMTTIVVIGRVGPEMGRGVIEKYFGKWRADGLKPDVTLPHVPANQPSSTNVPDASRVQDNVTLSETLALTRSNPDYYALELGNHVLGGAFYATRLYQDLREDTGLVYYVSSSFDIGKTRAFYTVSYGCDPPNVSRARSIVVRDLKDMQTTLVTPDELQQAKALLLREIPLSESSVGNIAEGLLSRAAHDLPLDEPTLAAHRYVKIDAEQIKKAFARWLRPDDLIEVTEGPVPR